MIYKIPIFDKVLTQTLKQKEIEKHSPDKEHIPVRKSY
jgi:hypothetical protein